MKNNIVKNFAARARGVLLGGALGIGLIALPAIARAQTATITGNLGGFDVVNDSGQEAHGFEVQIEGITQNDLYYTGYGQRYGSGVVESYSGGVYVRWLSHWDPDAQAYTATTPQYQGGPFSWNDCYSAGSRYAVSGCEHFGQSLRSTPTAPTITYRWLVADPTTPGSLIALDRPSAIVAPIGTVVPPVQSNVAPVISVEVEAPEPPETPEVYGDAQWMKVFKTELSREVTQDELTSTNTAIVPEDPTQVEVAWDIIQASPPSGGNGNQNRGSKSNSGSIGSPTTRSIVRRYELYKYTGTYDATTHQVVCADGNLCLAPSTGELGDFISANNSAVNLIPDVVTVTKAGTGGGTVTGGKVNCGNACSAFALAGSSVTLTAKANSGSAFAGWSGACSGVLSTCTVVVNGVTSATATFNTTTTGGGGGGGGGGSTSFTLQIAKSNPGTVTGTPAGDKTINCGSTCSAKFAAGTVVTLTAVPPAGKTFANWSNACSGTALTCTLTINGNVTAQANFNK